MIIKEKLNTILLIDDDEPTNFLHKLVIEESEITNKVLAVQSGQAALDYLTTAIDGVYPQPDLIFLDINMPVMNGWEFLERYRQLEKKYQGGKVVVMLTTSLNPDDQAKARALNIIQDFKHKPLTQDMLKELLAQFFPEKI